MAQSKIIKKIKRTIWLLVFATTLFILCLFGILHIPAIQNKIINKVTQIAKDKLGIELYYSKAKLRPLNTLYFEDFLLNDIENDTLIASKKFKITIKGILPKITGAKNKEIYVKRIILDKGFIRLYSDNDKGFNVVNFVDYLLPGDTTKESKPFNIKEVQIIDSRVGIFRTDTINMQEVFDPSRIDLSSFNLRSKNLQFNADTVNMEIRHLSFTDRCGLKVNKLAADLHLCKSFMHFNNLSIKTAFSEIESDKLSFYFDGFYQFGADLLFDKVRLEMDIKRAYFNFADLGYFSPLFKNNYQEVVFWGDISGPISNLNLRDFKLKTGKESYLEGDFDFTGLPDKNDLFIIANFKPFYLSTNDLINFNLPGNKRLSLPKALKNLTYISYKGNFTGLLNDFVSFGTIDSDYGRLGTDIVLQPDSTGNISFTGDLRAKNFKLGQLLAKEELIQNITSDVHLQGKFGNKNGVNSEIKGNIRKFGLHSYNYKNIKVDGDFSQKSFNGELSINDTNLALNFEGLIDFTREIPEFNFLLDVNHAELDKLKITDKKIPFSASFFLDMAGTGNNPSNLNAEVNLLNSLLTKADKQIQIYGLNLNIKNDSIENKVVLSSDMADASISGHYLFNELPGYFKLAADKLMPSLLINDSVFKLSDRQTNFDFNINLKNVQPVITFFTSNIQVAKNSLLTGSFIYDSTVNSSVHFESNLLRLNKNRGKQISANVFINDTTATADIGCSSLLLANRFFLDNYTFESSVFPDSISFSNRWLNWDTLVQKGAIAGGISFEPQMPMKPKMHLNLENISFIVNDIVWQTNSFNVFIDSSGFVTDKISLLHNNQQLYISGGITSNPSDSMIISIDDFNLEHLNMFSRNESTKLEGILKGEAAITGNSNNLTFNTDFFINQFGMNGQILGEVKLLSSYNSISEIVEINMVANRGTLETLKITGDYYPKEKGKLDLTCNLDKLRLEFAAPFVKSIFANLRGDASGTATITGTLKKPNISGEFKLFKTKFGIDYLNTTYLFTSDLNIKNNYLLFNNLELINQDDTATKKKDILLNNLDLANQDLNEKANENKAFINGSVYFKKLTEVYLDINMQAHKLMCLNTTIANNSQYYGKAYIDGLVRLSGSNSEFKINVDATTSKGTVFNVPLMESGEASRYSYITLVDSDTTKTETNNKELIDEDEDENIMELDFHLNVTPDATIQIVFDPQTGGLIKATGNGDLDLRINNVGDFQIVGEYIIEKGDYLFTLQNIINKRFTVKSGSSLRWSGDPVNASVDIDAVYPTRASLYNLFGYTDNNIQTQTRVDVNCELNLSGYLTQPKIGYDITLPNAEPNIQDRVSSKLSSEEQLTKQFLSLLVLNQFILDESVVQSDTSGGSSSGLMAAGSSNAFELLSNQFSNYLSQISEDVDIGFNYRPGSQVSGHEVEVTMSTQLLNDRISINGSVDMKTNAEAENVKNVVGDIDADYKLTKNGKLRLRAFNRSNNDEITEYSPYTQGVGIFYTEDFNTFGELWRRYFAFFRGDRKKKKAQDASN